MCLTRSGISTQDINVTVGGGSSKAKIFIATTPNESDHRTVVDNCKEKSREETTKQANFQNAVTKCASTSIRENTVLKENSTTNGAIQKMPRH